MVDNRVMACRREGRGEGAVKRRERRRREAPLLNHGTVTRNNGRRPGKFCNSDDHRAWRIENHDGQGMYFANKYYANVIWCNRIKRKKKFRYVYIRGKIETYVWYSRKKLWANKFHEFHPCKREWNERRVSDVKQRPRFLGQVVDFIHVRPANWFLKYSTSTICYQLEGRGDGQQKARWTM